MLPFLFDTSIRFWIEKIGIVADIPETFLQIEIDKQHCNLFSTLILQQRVLLMSP